MTRNRKSRAGWHQATLVTAYTHNVMSIAALVKAVLQTLAVWGLLPVGLADWLIRKGGLGDV